MKNIHLAALPLIIATCSCAHRPYGGGPDAGTGAIAGASAGAVVGGVAGAAVGDPISGAAMGAIAGGALGALIKGPVIHGRQYYRDSRGYCYYIDNRGKPKYAKSVRCS